MGPPRTPSRSPVSEMYRYSGLGCLFAAGVLMFMGGGWLVDRWLGVFPAFTVVGALAGAALSTFSLYRRIEEMSAKGREKRAKAP